MDQAQNNDLKSFKYARWIALTGLFMGINIIMSSFGIPVPGGFYSEGAGRREGSTLHRGTQPVY